MSSSLYPAIPLRKYERMRRLAEHLGVGEVDADALEIFLLVKSVGEELREADQAKLSCQGLGEGRVTVLLLLLDNKMEPLSHSKLADLMGVSKGTITGLVDGLERDGLVRRCEAHRDRRTRMIVITPTGLGRVRDFLPRKFKEIDKFMTELTLTERKSLIPLLLKILKAIPAYRHY